MAGQFRLGAGYAWSAVFAQWRAGHRAQDNLYGIDKGPKGQGRVFKIDIASGKVSTLHEFAAGPSGMRQTANDLILGKDGVLYGVTAYNRGLPLAPSTPTAATTPTGTLYRINAPTARVLLCCTPSRWPKAKSTSMTTPTAKALCCIPAAFLTKRG
jgi:hypothetical protein